MIVIKSPKNLDIYLEKSRKVNKKIGFVATMGALHDGHISLIKRSKSENDTTVCSIFVNPRQFNEPKDLEKYPRPIENDIKILTEAGTDVLFLPNYESIYPENLKVLNINLDYLDSILEGALRPGHFQGVALVVKRLFEFVKPDRAYFGQKDYQQTLVIKEVIKQFKLPIQIVISEILREENGLAMSSRNSRLNDEQRKKAGIIYKVLLQIKEDVKYYSINDSIDHARSSILKEDGINIEYLTVVNAKTLAPVNFLTDNESVLALVAVNYFGVRLLDNIYL